MPGRPTHAEARLILKRRDEAVALKVAGVDWLGIGRRLAADPRINSTGSEYERGYGWDAFLAGEDPPDDEHLSELARADVKRIGAIRRVRLDNNLEELRDIHDARLENLYNKVAVLLSDGTLDPTVKLAAIATGVRVLERQAKLHNLDIPDRVEPTIGDQPLTEEQLTERDRSRALATVLQLRDSQRENRAALEAATRQDPTQTDEQASG